MCNNLVVGPGVPMSWFKSSKGDSGLFNALDTDICLER